MPISAKVFIRQRVARLGQGSQQEGYRTIIALRSGHRAYFFSDFPRVRWQTSMALRCLIGKLSAPT